MKEILIKDIIRECNASLIIGDENLKIENFSKDTREINENDCYIGIKGETFDGNLFYEEAFKKGASACILEKESVKDIDFRNYNNKTIIIVDNSIKFLQELAAYKRSLYDIPVIAVTGSVGKTSTKEIISSVLSTKYNVLKTEGNYNNHIGLPLTILKLKEHNAMVLEMGMNHLNEITLLSKIAKPTIAVITNIGTAHIGNLGSRENILKAKLEIIDGLKENGTLIINNDNDMLHNNLDKINVNIKTIGINNKSDYMATNIVDEIFSSKFKIKDTDFEVNAPGEAFIYNSLVAYAVGKELNISDENIKKGIETFKLPSNRLEKIVNKTGTIIINDTYNCSYDSLINSIDMISKSDEKTTDGLRIQEYNMLRLSSQIAPEDYIDIRLRLPSGLDYIVVSKKKVEIPQIDGVDSANTIWLQLTEDEILTMSNAIVENYLVDGSVLYTAKYVEPGTQEKAIPTYVPSAEVQELMINNDSNILDTAKVALLTRYNSNTSVRNYINNAKSSVDPDDATSNISSGVKQEVSTAQEQRQDYLDALSGNN